MSCGGNLSLKKIKRACLRKNVFFFANVYRGKNDLLSNEGGDPRRCEQPETSHFSDISSLGFTCVERKWNFFLLLIFFFHKTKK